MAHHSIVFHLIKVAKRLQNTLGLKTDSFELSPSEASALIVIETHKNISQVAIALKLHLKPASIVRLIDELETMNLVVRVTPEGDRRKYVIKLTSKGVSEVKIIRERIQQIDGYIKNKLTKEEFKLLFSALDKLSEDADITLENLNKKGGEQ